MKNNKLFGYKVVFESVVTHRGRDPEYPDAYYEEYHNNISYVSHADEVSHVSSIHNIQPGRSAIIVWVEWDTGDSAGTSVNGGYEAIGIFSILDMASAQQLKKALEDPKSYKNSGYKIQTDDGQVFECGYTPWRGYFERLSVVHLETIIIVGKP